MKFQVLIASKGRPDCPTAQILCQGTVPEFTILVEPGEQAAYEEKWPGRTEAIPENGKGLAYVRQYALTEMKQKTGWYWMLDDDIQSFHEAANWKCKTVKAQYALTKAEQQILELEAKLGRIGMAGLEYQQFAWRATKDWMSPGYCDVAVAINRDAVGPEYDPSFSLKVDRDMTIQYAANGYAVVRLCTIAFSAPKNGSNSGGLQDEYKREKQELCEVGGMVAKWGTKICTHVVKPDGRHDCRIDWSALKGTI